jgi:hypothetical protein
VPTIGALIIGNISLEEFWRKFLFSPLNRPIDETEYRRLFAALAQEGAEEILLTDDPENVTNFRLIIELAEKGRLVSGRLFSISVFDTRRPVREFAETGSRTAGRRSA